MADKKQSGTATGISDEAVHSGTGRTWAEWFSVLDKAGADQMNHKEIAQHLYDKHEISGWWAQTVTVGYERERGLRLKHETPGGFKISRSKTINRPVEALYGAWKEPGLREAWLGDHALEIRKATASKSMRITWLKDGTQVSVNFYPKGDQKGQVVVEHTKLEDAQSAERMKTFWSEKLTDLKEALEPE